MGEMFSVCCGACGAPTPLESPDATTVRCGPCGHDGPLPEDAQAHLRAVRQLRQDTHARERQVRGGLKEKARFCSLLSFAVAELSDHHVAVPLAQIAESPT